MGEMRDVLVPKTQYHSKIYIPNWGKLTLGTLGRTKGPVTKPHKATKRAHDPNEKIAEPCAQFYIFSPIQLIVLPHLYISMPYGPSLRINLPYVSMPLSCSQLPELTL